jgi:hypothetical protein
VVKEVSGRHQVAPQVYDGSNNYTQYVDNGPAMYYTCAYGFRPVQGGWDPVTGQWASCGRLKRSKGSR